MNNVGNGTNAWIGAIRVDPAASQNYQFTWIDGTPMIYSNWDQNQPSGKQNCVHFYNGHGRWNDFNCNSPSTDSIKIKDFVCQIAA